MEKQMLVIVIISILFFTNCNATSVSELKTEMRKNDNQDTLFSALLSSQAISIENSDLPQYWNWRDVDGIDWTTPAKNQRKCPSCFFFSMVGAFESIIKIRERCADFNPDLSEQYLMSCVYMKYLQYNNSFFDIINGTIFESSFPYKAMFLIPCSWKSSNWKDYFVPCLSFNYSLGESREFIKNKLIEHGPILFPIYAPLWSRYSNGILGIWGKIHNSPEDYCSIETPKFRSSYLNHWVILVGWKDDEDVENGGYWICKNSWSPNWGYDGFFNIEFGSLNTNLGMIGWIDYNPDDFNWPPIGKPTLNGPTYMEANVEYEFSFSSIDPEGELVYYKFSWGDGTESNWLGPFESGSIVTVKHTWSNSGSYNVKVKAKNENGIESDWMPEYIKSYKTK
jgi:hypothetical protein